MGVAIRQDEGRAGQLTMSTRGDGIDPRLLDQLGEWSQIKHDIIEKYARAYTTIITRQPFIRNTV